MYSLSLLCRMSMANCRENRPEGMQSKQKKNKRKVQESCMEGVLRPCKTRCVDASEAGTQALTVDANRTVEEGQNHPWTNLQLILSLQSKEVDIQQSVPLSISHRKLTLFPFVGVSVLYCREEI